MTPRSRPVSSSFLVYCLFSATGGLSVPVFTNNSFFFPCVLAGPSFDYATYDSLVKHTIYDISPPGTSDAQAKAAGRRIPHGRKRVAYLHLTLGLAFLGIYSVFGGRGSYERILTPEWYTWSLVTRFAFVQIAGFIARTKYYAVWSLAEVSRSIWG